MRKVLQNIHHDFFVQHTVNEHILPLFVGWKLPLPCILQENINPVVVEIKLCTDAAHSCLGAVRDDAEKYCSEIIFSSPSFTP